MKIQGSLTKQAIGIFWIISLTILSSCNPDYRYKIEAPTGWAMYDTAMQGLKVRILKPQGRMPATDDPFVNIVIVAMEGRRIDDFTQRNMDYLQRNMGGITLLRKGYIDVSAINATWFTYTKVHNGVTRDMINYIIPVGGFAYMITCGANAGGMMKYRATFDKIAKSFRD